MKIKLLFLVISLFIVTHNTVWSQYSDNQIIYESEWDKLQQDDPFASGWDNDPFLPFEQQLTVMEEAELTQDTGPELGGIVSFGSILKMAFRYYYWLLWFIFPSKPIK